MRICASIVVLGLAALAVGCGKGSGGYSGRRLGHEQGQNPIYHRTLSGRCRKMPRRFNKRLASTWPGPRFASRSLPSWPFPNRSKSSKPKGRHWAYWVQYTATNSYGDTMYGQHDLFILKDDKVVGHYRTIDESSRKARHALGGGSPAAALAGCLAGRERSRNRRNREAVAPPRQWRDIYHAALVASLLRRCVVLQCRRRRPQPNRQRIPKPRKS